MSTQLLGYALHFKDSSILFDDPKTLLIVQSLVDLSRESSNLGHGAVVPIDSTAIIKETKIPDRTLHRVMKKLEDHYQLVFHTSSKKKVFRITPYLECLVQLKRLEGDKRKEFIRLFKEEGVDSALKFAPLPYEIDPVIALKGMHGTSIVVKDIPKSNTEKKEDANTPSIQNQTNINKQSEMPTEDTNQKHSPFANSNFTGFSKNWETRKIYKKLGERIGELIDENTFEDKFSPYFRCCSENSYEEFKKAVYSGNFADYEDDPEFCATLIARLALTLVDLANSQKSGKSCNDNVANPGKNDQERFANSEKVCQKICQDLPNSTQDLPRFATVEQDLPNVEHNLPNRQKICQDLPLWQIPYIYNTPYPLNAPNTITNLLNTFNTSLETLSNGLKEVKEVLQEIRGTITERSEVIVPTGSKGFKWSERSERHLNPLGPPLKNEVDNEVGKGLRGCGGEGEPREATDGQTPSPLKKETAAPAPSQPLDEKEDEEEEYDDSYEAWAAFDPELAKERWKYRDIEPGEFPDLSDEPDPEDISAKPRRIPKPRKPRDILRPNTYPDSPYRKKPLFDRERLECLLNPTSTTSVTTASEFFVMIFLDNVKYLVGETEDCDEEETLKCTSYVDPEKIWGIRLYDSETRDILDNCLTEMVTFIDDKKESINLRGETIPISFEPEFDIKEFCRIVSRAIEYKWHPRGPEDPEGWEELTREFFVDFSAPDSGSVIEGFSGSEEVFERNAQLKLFKYLDEEYETGGKLTPLEEFVRRFNELHINWREGYEYDIIREFLTSDKHPVQTLDKERIIRNAVSLSDELDLDMGDIWDIFFDRHVVDGKCFVLNITTSEPIFSSRRIAEKNEVLYGKRYSITHQILDEVLEERKREDAEELEWINSGEWMNDTDPLDMCPDDDELEGLGGNDS